MTKKDFIMFASVLNDWIASSVDNNGQVSVNHVKNLLDSLCYRLQQENPRFDKQRFVEACVKGQTTIRASDII